MDDPCVGDSAQGSCGFGVLSKGQWPYWSVAALATSNSFFLGGPVQGCGMCFEVQCLESGPVRSLSILRAVYVCDTMLVILRCMAYTIVQCICIWSLS